MSFGAFGRHACPANRVMLDDRKCCEPFLQSPHLLCRRVLFGEKQVEWLDSPSFTSLQAYGDTPIFHLATVFDLSCHHASLDKGRSGLSRKDRKKRTRTLLT